MTIDEAIKERQKVIEAQEKLYEDASTNESKEIIKSAADNDRQLVEWLKELKALREENKVLTSECGRLIKEKTDAEIDAFFIGMEESAKDNQEALEKRDKMLRDTVAELCEAKRLLKAAVEDISTMSCNNDTHSPDSCYICEKHGNCSYADSFKWCKADIALKLIGETHEP